MAEKNLSHFAVIFGVADPEEAATWYQEKLGFDVTFKWGDPVEYVVTNREESVSIHFSKTDKKMNSSIYIFCYDVDAVYEELKARGVERMGIPENQDYKMRDFELKDPYGNQIVFGTGIE